MIFSAKIQIYIILNPQVRPSGCVKDIYVFKNQIRIFINVKAKSDWSFIFLKRFSNSPFFKFLLFISLKKSLKNLSRNFVAKVNIKIVRNLREYTSEASKQRVRGSTDLAGYSSTYLSVHGKENIRISVCISGHVFGYGNVSIQCDRNHYWPKQKTTCLIIFSVHKASFTLPLTEHK